MVGTYEHIKGCRACGQHLFKTVINLGNQAVVGFPEEDKPDVRAPLELVQCESCELVQLMHTVNRDLMYQEFWYRSGINEQMREALQDVVVSAVRKNGLKAGDAVCDIGSNDGTLLSYYPSGVRKVGFEPAKNITVDAKDLRGWKIVQDYFTGEEAKKYCPRQGYKIITAIAMFYDLEKPVQFLQDVASVLAPDGLFVIQMNYLGLMLRNTTFDNISHEHLCYYSLTTLLEMVVAAGLRVVDVEKNDINGGSIRVYIQRKDGMMPIESSIYELVEEEVYTCGALAIDRFKFAVEEKMSMLRETLGILWAMQAKVYVYGASTRGLTILQTLIGDTGETQATDWLVAAAERDPRKYGRRMAGTNLRIVPEDVAREKADYMLLLPYHFWNSILKREKEWIDKGGKFIVPLPFPQLVSRLDMGDGKGILQSQSAQEFNQRLTPRPVI